MIARLNGDRLSLWCPGCDTLHQVDVGLWTWDGDTERPTISPSILTKMEVSPPNAHLSQVCHSFVRAGRWEFLGDSTHALAGQTVDCVPIPEGWFE